jgi:hypothetical protein
VFQRPNDFTGDGTEKLCPNSKQSVREIKMEPEFYGPWIAPNCAFPAQLIFAQQFTCPKLLEIFCCQTLEFSII